MSDDYLIDNPTQNDDTRKLFIVGAGLSGATVARIAADNGVHVKIADKRNHVAGNCYTEYEPRIKAHVHKYGAHIFHTKIDYVWEFISRFESDWTTFKHYVKTFSHGGLYDMPINLNTLDAVRETLSAQRNTDELAEIPDELLLDIARQRFMVGYTEKQWGKQFNDVPQRVTDRVKHRDNREAGYFDDPHQFMPDNGYTSIVENMLDHPLIEPAQLSRNVTREDVIDYIADGYSVYWTGEPTSLVKGNVELSWRSVRFSHSFEHGVKLLPSPVLNYADAVVPFTRQIEHKQFSARAFDDPTYETLISTEFPCEPVRRGSIGPAYPVRDDKSIAAYTSVMHDIKKQFGDKLLVGGRLGKYAYFNMDQAINSAMHDADTLLQNMSTR